MGRRRLYTDSYIKMSSDESHFNVSLIVRDKVTRQCPQTTIFEEKGESRHRVFLYPALALEGPILLILHMHRERERERENEWMNELYFTRVVELAQGLFTCSPRL